jgi:hypothetical protein
VKDENGDLLADSHNILNRWKNYFSHLLNVHNVIDVRQIEVRVHTAELLVPGPSHLAVEIAIATLEEYKSPGSDRIPAELGFTQPLTEMSSRNIKIIMFLGIKVRQVRRADNLTAICEPIV